LRSAFNSFTGQAAYVSYLDADGNGTVNVTDLGEFGSRFNLPLFP
jgi:hypothetical protein